MKIWIYADGRQQGPFELEELLDKHVTESTKVWYEGLPKWYPAGYLDELRPLLDGTLARQKREREMTEEERRTESQTPDSHADASGAEDENRPDDIVIEEEIQDEVPQEPEKHRFNEYPINRMPDAPCPPTYLGWTIVLTICCCSPVSLASIVTAVLTSNYYNSGNLRKARKCSEITAWLIMISLALGFFSVLLWDLIF